MNIYTPQGFEVLKITNGEDVHYRVMGSWAPGTTFNGDEWRINSGIEGITLDDSGSLSFLGGSGSQYRVNISKQGLHPYAQSILNGILDDNVQVIDIEEALEIFKCKK